MRIVRAILFVIGGMLAYSAAFFGATVQAKRGSDFAIELARAQYEFRAPDYDMPLMTSTPSMVIPGCVAFAGVTLQAVAVFAGGGPRERAAHRHRSVA